MGNCVLHACFDIIILKGSDYVKKGKRKYNNAWKIIRNMKYEIKF